MSRHQHPASASIVLNEGAAMTKDTTTVWRMSLKSWSALATPILANIVLADEINRARPRTQSAMLEAMEKRDSRSKA
jgi:MoxR-like ATPase